jgi:PAS domain S-box-containing protein
VRVHDGERDLDDIRARAFERTSDLAGVAEVPDGRLVDVNESFVQILGYDRGELIEQEAADGWLWVDSGQARRLLEDLDHGRSVTGVTVQLRAKDGKIHDVHGSAELVEAAGSRYVFAIGRDVSKETAQREEAAEARRLLGEARAERRRLVARLNLAVGEERTRIAQDLHDTTLQLLAVAKLRLHALGQRLLPATRTQVEPVEEAIDAAASATQALASELRRPALERDGLAAALDLALRDIAARSTLSFDLRDRSTEPPSLDVSTIAYEIVREILSGIELHSRASHVEIDLSEVDGGLLIAISDDDPVNGEAEPEHGWRHSALAPIESRLRLIGGRLRVTASAGTRTTVESWIPADLASGPEGAS